MENERKKLPYLFSLPDKEFNEHYGDYKRGLIEISEKQKQSRGERTEKRAAKLAAPLIADCDNDSKQASGKRAEKLAAPLSTDGVPTKNDIDCRLIADILRQKSFELNDPKQISSKVLQPGQQAYKQIRDFFGDRFIDDEAEKLVPTTNVQNGARAGKLAKLPELRWNDLLELPTLCENVTTDDLSTPRVKMLLTKLDETISSLLQILASGKNGEDKEFKDERDKFLVWFRSDPISRTEPFKTFVEGHKDFFGTV